MNRTVLREKATILRKQGITYSKIQKQLGVTIPKSTLSYWCRNIPLPMNYERRIRDYNAFNLKKAREVAVEVNRIKRVKYTQEVRDRIRHLSGELKKINTAKIALAMLYLGEGSKTKKGSLMFGNSDPLVIRLFLDLLRYCYNLDERKFRCTLQCRADQDVKKLEKFWSRATMIPLSQFYGARIDPRTIGRPSRKPNYKGVCRIDYFSGDILMELKQIIEVIFGGL